MAHKKVITADQQVLQLAKHLNIEVNGGNRGDGGRPPNPRRG